MAITGLKTWADGDALNTTNLNNDKSVLESKFNAGITTADLSASAGITNAQLANSTYEFTADLHLDGVLWNTASVAVGNVVAMAGLPADTNSEGYTIEKISYSFVDPAGAHSTSDKVDLVWGYFSGGTWTQTTMIKDAITIPVAQENGVITPTTSTLTTSTTNNEFLALVVDTINGATDFTTSRQKLMISVKLKRTNGLK